MIVPDPPATAGVRAMAASPPFLGPQLLAWYRSDQGTWQDAGGTTPATSPGQTVARWDDLSGNGRHMVQSGATPLPTIAAASILGSRAVAFTGSQLLRGARIAGLDGGIPCLMTVAPPPTNLALSRIMATINYSDLPSAPDYVLCNYARTTGTAWYAQATTSGGTTVGGGNASNANPAVVLSRVDADDVLRSYTGLSDYVQVSGATHARTTHQANYIGGNPSLSNPWIGSIYEVAIILGPITATQARRLLLYAKARYGL